MGQPDLGTVSSGVHQLPTGRLSQLLPLAEFVYNNTSHSATMVTPFFANKGFHPKLEVSLKPVVSDTAHQVATDLKELHLYLRDQVSRAIRQYEDHSALRCLPIPPFKVGDTVW